MPQSDGNLLDAALRYATDLGWPVFPLAERGKQPKTARGLYDATTDPDTIRVWWSRWPNANIGVPAGTASGIAVIDVDAGNGDASLDQLVERHGDPLGDAGTPYSRTGGGGRHYVYRRPSAGLSNTVSRIAPGIDTRGDGGYIAVPPSVHDSGRVYEWQLSPFDVPLAELPEWLLPPARKATAAPRATASDVPLADRITRAAAYLATMDPAIQGSGGHNAAYAAATAMAHGFDLPADTAKELLWAEFSPRCLPPWDYSDPRDRRDLERKVDEAIRQQHDQPRGWLVAEGLSVGDAGHGAEQAANIIASAQARETPPEPPRQRRPRRRSRERLGSICDAPGTVGDLARWITATAYMPQPALALANALAFFGAVVGRKVRTPSDLRTNIYCLGVGESGCGKDHSRRSIKRLVSEAGLTDRLLGGEDVSSDSAILQAVHANPTLLFQFDEIGHLLGAATARNAQHYLRAIPVVLTKLYSSANTTYLGKEYAGSDDRKDIQQPNVCMYGTTVPGRLFDSLSPDEIRDGFLGRMLVFRVEDPDPEEHDSDLGEVPSGLVESVRAWWARDDMPRRDGNVAAVMEHQPITVPIQDDARADLEQFRQRCRSRKIAGRDEDNGTDSLWSRATEHASKIALTVASGCEFGQPIISRDIARWSIRLVDVLVGELVEIVQDHVSRSDFGRATLRVLRTIKTDADGVTKSEITRRTQGMDRRQRDHALAELQEAGRIVAEQRQTGARGRPSIVFRAIGDAGDE